MWSELTILIIGLVVFFVLDSFGTLFSTAYLFFAFLFAYINIEGQTTLANFYLISVIFVLIAQIAKSKFAPQDSDKANVLGYKAVSRWRVNLLGIGIGLVIFAFMYLIQAKAEGSIIGIPSLAISAASVNPLIYAYLGIIENRTFFTLYEVMTYIPSFLFQSKILPLILTPFFFAIFHLTAYHSQVSSLVFAFIIFTIWLGLYVVLDDTMPADSSHALWNGTISLGRILKIA